MRKIIVAVACCMAASAANAAVFQYQFRTYYDGGNSACGTSGVLAASSLETGTSVPISGLTVNDFGDSVWAPPKKLFLDGGLAAADFLTSAPASVIEAPVCSPIILGNPVSLHTPLASTEPPVELPAGDVTDPAENAISAAILTGEENYPVTGNWGGISSSVGFTVSDSTPLPEPSSWAAFGLGLAAVAGAVRFRRNQRP